jgi:V/A-type H+-transporting ATPase subunit D
MGTVALNKASLQKEREHLRLYERILPSLDLKRMQLTGALSRAKEQVVQDQDAVRQLEADVAERIPMLANREIDLSGLAKSSSIDVEQENLVGVTLPRLKSVDVTIEAYSKLATPAWVDTYVTLLERMLHLLAQVKVSEKRVEILEYAVRRITQRVNLFEKILIPDAQKNIKRIRIFLSDMERAAIVRSKRAKAMRAKQTRVLREEGLG